MILYSTCMLPDGRLYDESNHSHEEVLDQFPTELAGLVSLENELVCSRFNSPIGELLLEWNGAKRAAASSLKYQGELVMSSVYLPGVSAVDELQVLRSFVDVWRSSKLVNEYVGHSTEEVFEEFFEEKGRPLICSINWCTLDVDEYNEVANYDLFIGAAYFKLAAEHA